jgi:putative ATPase
MEPLAYRLRPRTLDEVIGQAHLVGKNGAIRRMIANRRLPSLILYGGPGTGKTTIALAACADLDFPYHTFNASTDNKAALKDIIDEARLTPNTVIIVDEIHRMKKDIQDYLLPYVERGAVTLIGLTTVNPYHSVNPAIRSRTLIYKLNELTADDLRIAFKRARDQLGKALEFTPEAEEYIIGMAGGEIRAVINMVEAIGFASREGDTVTLESAKAVILRPSVHIDKSDDNYYDTLSGLHKSIRGSDADAALHYLAKLLTAEDFLPLVRRLYCICYEDISLANPAMGPKVRAACEAALELGMPEARLPLASIVVDMALSPKSNSTCQAIDTAMKDIEEGKSGPLPPHLKNIESFDPRQVPYKYPHDYPGAWVDQQYLPDAIRDRQYYIPKPSSKYEEAIAERYQAIQEAKRKNKSNDR